MNHLLSRQQRNRMWIVWVSIPLWVAIALSANAESPDAAFFGETVDVRVLDLEVVVTDKQRQRVHGLGPEDFRLLIDGDPTPIAFFSEIDDRKVRRPGETTTASAPNVRSGQRLPVHYLLFVDRFFGFEALQRRLLEAMEESLSRLEAGDRMAVIAYSGRRIETLSGWTDSPQQLKAAFDELLEGTFGGTERALEEFAYHSDRTTREVFLAEGDDPLLGGIPDGEDPGLQSRKKQLEGQLDLVSRAVAASMQSFAQPRGRKVLLLLGGGWPRDTVAQLAGVDAGSFGTPKSTAELSLRRISSTANRLGYTIYPVDVPANWLGGRELEQHASLDFLARETGGIAFKNSHGSAALGRVLEDVGSYYWMGFSPPWKGDGKDHVIKIEALRPGLEVRTRRNFRTVPKPQQIDAWVEASTLLETMPAVAPLGLAWGPFAEAGRRRLQVPLEITIPLDGVLMVPSAEGFTARLEIRISAIDARGALNEIETIPFTFSGQQPPPPGGEVVYETSLLLRKQSHDVVVVVYDQISGAMLVGRHGLDPDKP